MEVLPRGESNKRKLKRKIEEIEEEPVPPGLEEVVLPLSPESNESEDCSIAKLDYIKKEGQLEILPRPKRVFRDYYDDDDEEDEEEDEEEEEYVFTPSLRSNDVVSDYPKILTEYTTDEGQILQSARRVFCEEDISVGEDIVENEYFFPSDFFSGIDVDAELLKSHLSYGQQDCTDWESLAKYIIQLRKSQGFDLDKYKNLGSYDGGLLTRLSEKELHFSAKKLEKSMEIAMKFYEEAGGGELREGKLVKANVAREFFDIFYITFKAKNCLDGKERCYQAKVTYDDGREEIFFVNKRRIMVRLKKEPTD